MLATTKRARTGSSMVFTEAVPAAAAEHSLTFAAVIYAVRCFTDLAAFIAAHVADSLIHEVFTRSVRIRFDFLELLFNGFIEGFDGAIKHYSAP